MVEAFGAGAYLLQAEAGRAPAIIMDDGEAPAKLAAAGVSFFAKGGSGGAGDAAGAGDAGGGAREREARFREAARRGTIAHGILEAHDCGGGGGGLRLRFDSLTSHDITYVGIIQTARASGMERFPVPYVLTNCHNSLCAVGGTINQDDHVFALSAARKYGGIYVPPHLAVIHSYNREMMAGCGKMILGSDSHTRYGALGTMAVGEGGGELAKQLVGRTYDMPRPEVIAVCLTGRPAQGVGPHDVALSIIKAVFGSGLAKNKVMEFVGDGVAGLSVDFRNGIDVMTTETTCWSSIWETDSAVRDYLEARGRGGDYRELRPAAIAYYDGLVLADLSRIEPQIALPFHPSNAFSIRELQENARDILAKAEEEGARALGVPGLRLGLPEKFRDGGVWAQQGIIAGCAGGIFESVMAAAGILKGKSLGSGNFSLSVYPESQPVYLELLRSGACEALMSAGALMREAFCGPCFGAGDTPANGELSVRHVTRNFPNREGSRPGEGQAASVALMDARSIAATAASGGRITAATEIGAGFGKPRFFFDRGVYEKRVYDGFGRPEPGAELRLGPNIKDWPAMPALPESLLVAIAGFITDPVTTTDELIPSGETSSYRSNPLRLAEFALSRRDPGYVARAKAAQALERERAAAALQGGAAGGEGGREKAGGDALPAELAEILAKARGLPGCGGIGLGDMGIGSAIYARKPGDGSAREQAASCQRVLGGAANFALEYATKRYRSNLINWGILPLAVADEALIPPTGGFVFFPGIAKALREYSPGKALAVRGLDLGSGAEIEASLGELTDGERQTLLDGCLINHYARKRA